MSGRRTGWRSGIRVRGLGIALLAGVWLAAHIVMTFMKEHPHDLRTDDPQSAGMFLLAMLAYVSASAAAAFLLLGPHLFDRVRVSARWARIADDYPGNRTEQDIIARHDFHEASSALPNALSPPSPIR